MKHILKYTNTTIAGNLQRGFGYMLSRHHKKLQGGTVALSGKERWNNIDYVCQSNPVLPCLFDLRSVIWDTVDPYDMVSNDEWIEDEVTTVLPIAKVCGQFVIGNFTDVLFPSYDPQQDTMVTDVMASCVATALKNDFQSSFGYLRLGQMLMAIALENSEVIPQTDCNKRNYVSKLFKL